MSGQKSKPNLRRNSGRTHTYLWLIPGLFFLITSGCLKENSPEQEEEPRNLTIFFINDLHGQIDQFAGINNIIDLEKENNPVLFVCSGDIFSGNPVTDQYPEKGYPVIDLMNRTEIAVTAVGNHDFDYGTEILEDRIEQSTFPWICANLEPGGPLSPSPAAFFTAEAGDLKVTFLGLLETNGKPDAVIPSTHPAKIQDLEFVHPETAVPDFSGLKSSENADLLIALSHLGSNGSANSLGDFQLARQFPFFDLIIGGHSHQLIDTVINRIPIFQAGSYLNYLGKIKLTVQNKTVRSYDFELINLNSYTERDDLISEVVEDFNQHTDYSEVIGYSQGYHNSSATGCFFTQALHVQMGADLVFQNTGGIRAGLDEGDITLKEIYEIEPFNNGTVIYTMKVSEVIAFLKGSGSGFYYSGVRIRQTNEKIEIRNEQNYLYHEDDVLKVGISDYIAAVHDAYFPATGETQKMTAAETIIAYLQNHQEPVNFVQCNRYFRYQ